MRTVLRMCLLAGIPVSAGLFFCAAALLTAADLPPLVCRLAALLPILAGSFAAGAAAARRLRHRGLRNGAAAALFLTLLWYAAACIVHGCLFSPVTLLLTLPAGMLGGVIGVGMRAPVPSRRHHISGFLRARIRLRMTLLHRPQKTNHARKMPENDPLKDPNRKN